MPSWRNGLAHAAKLSLKCTASKLFICLRLARLSALRLVSEISIQPGLRLTDSLQPSHGLFCAIGLAINAMASYFEAVSYLANAVIQWLSAQYSMAMWPAVIHLANDCVWLCQLRRLAWLAGQQYKYISVSCCVRREETLLAFCG